MVGAATDAGAAGLGDDEAKLVAMLHTLLGQAPMPVGYWDRDFALRWINAAAEGLMGESAEGLIGRQRWELYPAASDHLRQWHHHQLVVEGRSGVVIEETPVVAPDGRVIYWTIVDTAVLGSDGRVAGVLTISQDVTEQVHARQRAEAERQRLQTIIDALPARISVWGRDGSEVLMNAPAKEIWERMRRPPIREGQMVAGVFYPDGRQVSPDELPLWRVFQTGTPVRDFPSIIRMPDGGEEPTLVSVTPLFGPDGQIDGAVALGFDLRPELERHELARRARAMEELAQLKTRLLASVSHELRTPLNHVKGYADTLLRRGDTLDAAERMACLEVIRSAAGQLERRINDLLDASQIEAGGLPLTIEPVEAPVVAERVAERLRRLTSAQRIEVVFPPNFPPAPADAGRIEQVLENLIGNALHHASGARIRVGGRARRAEIELWVSDDGPGIAPERQANLFKPLIGPRTPAGGGLGLGLAICRGIVEAHGGRIWSAPRSRGLAIHFTLPRRRRPVGAAARPAPDTRHGGEG